jgi:hypothetical protein
MLGGKRPAEQRTFLASTVLTGLLRAGADPAARAFGMELASTFTTVRARMLPPPSISYGLPECLFPGTQVWGVTPCSTRKQGLGHCWG